MTVGLTGIDALEAEMRDRLAAKDAEIERLRRELAEANSYRHQLYEALRLSNENYKALDTENARLRRAAAEVEDLPADTSPEALHKWIAED